MVRLQEMTLKKDSKPDYLNLNNLIVTGVLFKAEL